MPGGTHTRDVEIQGCVGSCNVESSDNVTFITCYHVCQNKIHKYERINHK